MDDGLVTEGAGAGPEPRVAVPPSPEPTSRRGLLAAGAAALAAAATLAAPRAASAQVVVRPPTRRPPPPAATGDSLLRLVRRATNGVTEEELARAKSLGFAGYLDYHLKATAIDDRAVEAFITTKYPELALDGLGLYQLDQFQLYNKFTEATIYRAAFSKRQLYERMVQFWSDHFSIYYFKVNYLHLIADREVVRKHALGKFPDLLRASAHSPAMLEYLDNTRSRNRNVNQNYARELMELHTMGADGGYSQTDVEEVTRCLTGWTIQGRGEAFRFDSGGHDFTAKTVLGFAIPVQAQGPDGVKDGDQVLDILLKNPSTAKFISTKMIRWLLQYEPPAALVDKVVATYTKTGGDIPSMIRDILTPANLLAAPAKYRQPYQMVTAALRATQPTVTNVTPVGTRQLDALGQGLFRWEDPDGWPDNVDWWAGTILPRWNFMSFLTGLATGDVVVDVAPLMAVSTPDAIADAIGRRAYGGEMPAALRTHVRGYLASAPITVTRVRDAFALALSSSSFQWFCERGRDEHRRAPGLRRLSRVQRAFATGLSRKRR
ncbi:MAG: DUF1800 domain-containing protein, partial [Gemmatimonadetes bacterium]|nr:DUF1800 domain-containing protein [Gemmatimonadota bacterium]